MSTSDGLYRTPRRAPKSVARTRADGTDATPRFVTSFDTVDPYALFTRFPAFRPVPELMARPSVYIHVGLPKTGTTYLQDRLWRNRDIALRTAGVLYPGVEASDHFHAAVHLQPDRYLDWVDPAHSGVWKSLVSEMRDWPGTSVLSHELYSTATAEQAARVIADLDFADVHVIVTVRDLARQIPSVWQENVKNQRRATLDEFLASLRDAPAERQEPFWEFQDHVRILSNWAAELPPERVHVVTVPRRRTAEENGRAHDDAAATPSVATTSGPTSLWDRFVGVVGADGAVLDRPVPPSNKALTPPQVELLRRLNIHLQPENIAWAHYEYAVKRRLVGDILFEESDRRGRTLSAEQSHWVALRSDEMIADITAAGYDIVGDLEDLRVVPGGPDRDGPDRDGADADGTGEPTTGETLDVAVAALAEVLRTMPVVAGRRRLRSRVGALLRGGRRRVAAIGVRRRGR